MGEFIIFFKIILEQIKGVSMGDIFMWLYVFVTSVSTLALLLEASGFMPLKYSRWMHRNKLALTIDVLKELGCDINEKKKNILNRQTDAAKKINDKLARITINKEVEIGRTSMDFFLPCYIDMMGATTEERFAMDFANLLVSKLNELNLEFDFVATPKLGSPILGYEFSKLVKKPLMLHSEETKFRPKDKISDKRMALDFNWVENPLLIADRKLKALIVDDSTTGGRKMRLLIDELRKNNYEVSDCLVVFEPQGKGAKEKLSKLKVSLYSITQTPKGQ